MDPHKKALSSILAIWFWFFSVLPGFAQVYRYDHPICADYLSVPVSLWQDDSAPQKGLVVALHGLTFYGAAFEATARHLAAQGYPVYAPDLRGFGRWRDEGYRYPSDEKVHFGLALKDASNLVEYLHRERPGLKLFCLGESLGANMALSLASLEPGAVSGAILAGLCVKQTYYPRPRWVEDFLNGVFFPHKPFNLAPYSRLYLASDPAVTKTYLNDPKIFRTLTCTDLIKAIITSRRAIKYADQVPKSVQLLIIAGGKDLCFKPDVLPAFATRLGKERTTVKVIPKKGHLLLELQPLDDEIAKTMDDWLAAHTDSERCASLGHDLLIRSSLLVREADKPEVSPDSQRAD